MQQSNRVYYEFRVYEPLILLNKCWYIRMMQINADMSALIIKEALTKKLKSLPSYWSYQVLYMFATCFSVDYMNYNEVFTYMYLGICERTEKLNFTEIYT